MRESLQQVVESWLSYERELFFLLNGSDSIFLDNLMWSVTGRWVWIPLYCLVVLTIFWKTQKKEALLVLLFLVVLVTICDQFSASFTRPFFERYRPAHHPEFAEFVQLVNNNKGGRYGFISSHATNSFGFAVFLSLLFRHRWVTVVMLSWALLKSYSRIYLGLHFITDFIGGVIAGVAIAVLLYYLFIFVQQKIFGHTPKEKYLFYSKQHGNWLAAIAGGYLLFVVAFSGIIKSLPH